MTGSSTSSRRSTLYAIDIVAWDIFIGLALLFAVPAFERGSKARLGLIASGLLCLMSRERARLACARDLRLHDRVRAHLPPAQRALATARRLDQGLRRVHVHPGLAA